MPLLKISKKFLNNKKKETELNCNYPVYMTDSFIGEPDIQDFSNFVAQCAWSILDGQGYAMNNFGTYFTEMWCQEHHHLSSMERHIHGDGAVISGFYFLSCPPNSCKVIYHDQRDSKVITSLPEKNPNEATHASNSINFVPKEGMLMLANSWLPHSFSKNESNKPMSFIHFNLAVAPVQEKQNVEII